MASLGKSVAFWLLTTLLLLVPGVALVIAGVATNIVGDTAQAVQDEWEGDDDGDGRVDEDGLGDADNSQSNPAAANGPQELTNPRDDDSDGRSDEDLAPRDDVQAAIGGVSQLGTAFTWFGVLLIIAYLAAVILRTTRTHQVKMASANASQPYEPRSPPR